MALLDRVFTREGESPFETAKWVEHDVHIKDKYGKTVFKQDKVAFPDFWSEQSVQVVASKYFSRAEGMTPESSLDSLIRRVVFQISMEGMKAGYFHDGHDKLVFEDELMYLILHQYGTFNSPVWFNIGVPGRKQQAAACFLVSVDDSMEGILEWYKTEGLIFSGGSGSGVNISSLRSRGEPISKGGVSSGPMSFMKAADASSGTIKSGGTTRRAAKMVIMNADHPDILEFVNCKVVEERKAQALIAAGFDGSFEGEVYSGLDYQNANNSVRVPDAFMRAVERDEKWETRNVVSHEVRDSYSAKDMLYAIAKANWESGDPGVQFHDTINHMHTCPMDGWQHTSNPCGEYLFLDWTSCNLATLNLLKFKTVDAEAELGFNRQQFQHAVKVFTLAQDILIGFADYPLPKIATETKKYRTIGLNFANLGAYLMSCGIAYDSEQGRHFASHVSSLMTAYAYWMSGDIAAKVGSFERFEDNRVQFREVLNTHRMSAFEMAPSTTREWDSAYEAVCEYGARNAQVTLAAPTGTVSFMLGCDTTGVEPSIALVAEKSLAGGGSMRLVNNQVYAGLRALGYDEQHAHKLVEELALDGIDAFLSSLSSEYLPVFACALPASEKRKHFFLDPEGHLEMVAAIQPFLSGGISKTVNVPHETTVDEIMQLYMLAWKRGLKSVTIYRDGCKQAQPLNIASRPLTTASAGGTATDLTFNLLMPQVPYRRRLPDERPAINHKFSVGGLEGYITTGLYHDGKPGEVFLTVSKQGTTISGLTDAFATLLSIALQYGVPLEDLVRKFSYMRFEPMGYTSNPDLRVSTSIIDYLFRWMEKRFLPGESVIGTLEETVPESHLVADQRVYDSPLCLSCGGATIRSGACFTCTVCFQTSGCS